MKVQANTLRTGNVLEQNNKLWVVTKYQIIQPGKGGAFIQVEMKDIKTGVKTNERYRTTESVERVRVDEEDYQFLFADGDMYTFMNVASFEQISVHHDVIGDAASFLQEGMVVQCGVYEHDVLYVNLPATVTVEVLEADPVVKGQTASSSYKTAIVDNGIKVMVPPHIGAGMRIVVRTEDSSYVERAKD